MQELYVVQNAMHKSIVIRYHDLSSHFGVDKTVGRIYKYCCGDSSLLLFFCASLFTCFFYITLTRVRVWATAATAAWPTRSLVD